MNRSCTETRRRITRDLDGELPPKEQAKLAAHLEQCAGCRAALDEQRSLRSLWRELPAPVSRPEDRRAIIAAAERLGRSAASARPGPFGLRWDTWLTAGALAASVLLAIWSSASFRSIHAWGRWPTSSTVLTVSEAALREEGRGLEARESLELPNFDRNGF